MSERSIYNLPVPIVVFFCYFPFYFIFPLVIYLFERENPFVVFHAKQAATYHGINTIAGIIIYLVTLNANGNTFFAIYSVVATVGAGYFGYMSRSNALNGERFKIPLIGDLVGGKL